MNSRGQAENGLYAVSVVIPAYNEEASVPAVFGAVRSSLVGVDVCEIIFVDDGSTDATAERVRTLCAQDSSVRLIRSAVTSASSQRFWQGWKRRAVQP